MAPVSFEQATSSLRTGAGGRHLLALDGVRGLAILMVVCCHAFESDYEGRGGIISFIGQVIRYGIFGVDLFFVLSGFLITGILYDSLQDGGYFRKFYIRRALRIFPLYYGVLIVCLLLTKPLHLHWGDMGWLLVLYLQNLHPKTIMFFSPGGGISLYHFWSLAIEEQFYLIWPATVYFLRDRRKLLIVTLVGAVASLPLRILILNAGGSPFAVHVTTVCRADSLLLGGALAILYRSSVWSRVARLAPWGFLGFGSITVLAVLYFEHFKAHSPTEVAYWRGTARYSLLALTFVSLIAWSLKERSACQRLFQVLGLRFLGKYSYGLYVLHVFVLNAMLLPLRNVIAQQTHSKLLAVASSGIVSLLVSLLIAWLSYRFYERPFLRLKRYFEYSRSAAGAH